MGRSQYSGASTMAEATYSIHGDIQDTELEQLTKSLEAGPWRIRLGNEDDLLLQDEHLDMTIYTSRAGSRRGWNYLVSAAMSGELEEVRGALQTIADLLAARGIVYNFEFMEEGRTGEEQIIRHPDF
jgi:hypothetical protein